MALTLAVNGQSRVFADLASPSRLAEVVAEMNLKADRVAVEHNGDIAPRAAWDEVSVSSGDRLEIVHFVGGGHGTAEVTAPIGRGSRRRGAWELRLGLDLQHSWFAGGSLYIISVIGPNSRMGPSPDPSEVFATCGRMRGAVELRRNGQAARRGPRGRPQDRWRRGGLPPSAAICCSCPPLRALRRLSPGRRSIVYFAWAPPIGAVESLPFFST